jgi:hypothetical protein
MMGNSARERCRGAGLRPDGLLVAGWVMGIIGTIVLAFSVLMLVAVLFLGACASSGPG